ncbi:STAS domain-containing protein [Marinobacter persicus]|jgi:anti-anti-sigma factor|uniref:Anti-anti-sigma factor n=1 Tax=Marinobacter persicus TaxID=930118 RepID=A0A2S6G7K5_9GAMM|nr:STAS domain-containing protein [Marinobacter persicus]KXS52896.1 MAG: anti-sigma-factor antagonist [Marinobacter sp. T13-3]PPK51998.1 anti-anti-sigma factor [Marinobacter persicus]PPK55034.1 anti-anti-sigma factor [Marinobacter persicus]PPK58395.1 anti-anti-sigma factor [Marinobacter persicus]
MPIAAHRVDDGQTLVIRVDGRFDFSTHQAFRDAYEQADPAIKRYVVDLSDTTYLDSSALGMLLLLRDHAGGDSARISIENCNSDVRRILSISNFEQLFRIC